MRHVASWPSVGQSLNWLKASHELAIDAMFGFHFHKIRQTHYIQLPFGRGWLAGWLMSLGQLRNGSIVITGCDCCCCCSNVAAAIISQIEIQANTIYFIYLKIQFFVDCVVLIKNICAFQVYYQNNIVLLQPTILSLLLLK